MKITWSYCVLLALIMLSCKSTIPMGQVNYLSERDQAISMRCVGIGNTKDAAEADAAKNAVDVLLFRGLPDSSQKVPLLGYNEAEIKSQHSNYFKQLYNNKRYLSFVMNSQPVSDLKKQQMTVEVKINLRALRSDLEGQGLIRRFGY